MGQLARQLQSAQKIALVSHVFPDGDAIGSLLGLAQALKSLGKQPSVVLSGPLPPVFAFLDSEPELIVNDFPDLESLDLIVVLDVSDCNRTGFAAEVRTLGAAGKLAYVDHHPHGDVLRLAAAHLHRLDAAATTELLADLLQELEVKMTPAIATCLLTGLYTDTGGFQHANTTPHTLDLASELMRRGARLKLIVQEVSHHKSVASLKLLGVALDRLKLAYGGQCAVSILTQEDFRLCEATAEDVAGIIGELNVLPEAKLTLLLAEIAPGVIRGSLRTPDSRRTNVGRLAGILGGGGHPRAAGFTLQATPERLAGGWHLAANPAGPVAAAVQTG